MVPEIKSIRGPKCPHCGHENTAFIWNCQKCGKQIAPVFDVPKLTFGVAEAIGIISDTSRSITTISPLISEKVDLSPLKGRMDSLEKSYTELQTAQDKIEKTKDEMVSSLEEFKGEIEKFQEIRTLPEVKEFLNGITKLEEFYQIDTSKIAASAIAQMLRLEMKAIDSRLTAQIEANTTIREAYTKVLNQQSATLKWLKWATFLIPLGVALAPTIEFVIRQRFGA